MVQLITDTNEKAVILVSGETSNLNNLIENSGSFTKAADDFAPTSFEKGFTVWIKN